MKAGSVLIYSGSVFHGGGENKSQSDRIGINITYTLGWLRQEENQYLTCPPEMANSFRQSCKHWLAIQWANMHSVTTLHREHPARRLNLFRQNMR